MISKIVYFFDETTGFSDHPVFVGLLKHGTVVQGTDFNEIGGKEPMDKFGHIVGFSRNQDAELLLRVQWDWEGGSAIQNMHPGNLILLA